MMRTRNERRATRHRRENFKPLPGSRHPFSRAHKLALRIRAIVDMGLNPVDRKLELDALPAYTSRGHGGKHRPKGRQIGGQWSQDRSKYIPGCGAR